jgi:hypothetical protein
MRERWQNKLDPSIFTGAWTDAENKTLKKKYAETGGKWCLIAAALEGRTDIACRKQWYKLYPSEKLSRVKQPHLHARPADSRVAPPPPPSGKKEKARFLAAGGKERPAKRAKSLSSGKPMAAPPAGRSGGRVLNNPGYAGAQGQDAGAADQAEDHELLVAAMPWLKTVFDWKGHPGAAKPPAKGGSPWAVRSFLCAPVCFFSDPPYYYKTNRGHENDFITPMTSERRWCK